MNRHAELDEQVRRASRRLQEIQRELEALEDTGLSKFDVRRALADFEPLWAALTTIEQTRAWRL